MNVTYQQLKGLGACNDDLSLFAATWGESVEVNAQSCAEAAERRLNVVWAAGRLLTDEQWDEYCAKCKPIYAEYYAKLKPILDEYWAKRKPIDDEYLAKIKPINDEYLAKRWQIFATVTQGE